MSGKWTPRGDRDRDPQGEVQRFRFHGVGSRLHGVGCVVCCVLCAVCCVLCGVWGVGCWVLGVGCGVLGVGCGVPTSAPPTSDAGVSDEPGLGFRV